MSRRKDGSYRYDGAWRRVRDQVLERDAHLCQIRGAGCTVTATQMDHIVPVDEGGALYDPANLRASCEWDNKHREYQGRKLRKRRPAREWPKPNLGEAAEKAEGDDDGVVIV